MRPPERRIVISTPVSSKSCEVAGDGDFAGINTDRHCTGGESSSESTCEAPKRDYKIGLRVGLLFAIMATSTIGMLRILITPPHRLTARILTQT